MRRLMPAAFGRRRIDSTRCVSERITSWHSQTRPDGPLWPPAEKLNLALRGELRVEHASKDQAICAVHTGWHCRRSDLDAPDLNGAMPHPARSDRPDQHAAENPGPASPPDAAIPASFTPAPAATSDYGRRKPVRPPRVLLPADESVALREKLACELKGFTSTDALTTWAHRTLSERYPSYDAKKAQSVRGCMPGLHEGYHRYLQHVVQAQGRQLVSPRDARFDGNRTLHSA
jgi:hypothetical protein